MRHMDYIHFNPVKHGHVAQVKDWPYSSFHWMMKLGIYPPDWGAMSPATKQIMANGRRGGLSEAKPTKFYRGDGFRKSSTHPTGF